MVLIDNIISYWKFNEAGATDVRLDETASNNDLTPAVTTPVGVGKISNCVDFTDNTDNSLIIPNASLTNFGFAGSCSFSLWVKPQSKNVNQRAMFAREKAGDRPFLAFMYPSDDGTYPDKAIFVVNDASSVVTTNALTMGVWTYLVFVYTYVANNTSLMDIYVNGVIGATQTTNAVGPISAGTGNFEVGSREFTTSRLLFNGSIDEMGVWNRALTSTDVTTLYNNGRGYTYPFTGPTTPFSPFPSHYNT